MKTPLLISCILLFDIWGAIAQLPDIEEKQRLLEEALERLDKASLLNELSERQAEIESIDEEEALAKINEAKATFDSLVKEAALTALPKVASEVSGQTSFSSGEKAVAASDSAVLGPEPKKAPRGTREEGELRVDSESATTDLKAGIFVFEEDVVARHPQFVMHSDKLILFAQKGVAKEQQMQKAVASGGMVTIDGKDKDGRPIRATCREAIYENNRVRLRGMPEIISEDGRWGATSNRTYVDLPIGDEGGTPQWHGPNNLVSNKKLTEEN